MIFRTSEQKSDLKNSFYRPDRPFFASGACHVLAHAFIESNGEEWQPVMICPEAGFRGSHVFVTNYRLVFDYHGFSSEAFFIDHYFKKMQRFFPDWRASLVELTMSPVSEEFCSRFNHRRPDQFYEDPRPRAFKYVHRHLKTTTDDMNWNDLANGVLQTR